MGTNSAQLTLSGIRFPLKGMEQEPVKVVLGISIPSIDPVFLGVVCVHVLFGLAAVIAGAVAMFSKKGRGRHSNLGAVYFWLLFAIFVSMSTLSFLRWAENYHLFILGVLSFASACFGRAAVQWRWRQWPRLHLTAMGASYIFMLNSTLITARTCPCGRHCQRLHSGCCLPQSGYR